MDIMISENLRELRKARGNTQEELADFLTVSPQAVSKWERGEGLPDISILPKIALFYDVSLDELFGMEESRREDKIQDYIRRGDELANRGLIEEDIALYREAIKEFPNDMRIVQRLARFLHFKQNRTEEELREVIVLCDRILDESTDNALRGSAVQLSCLAYTSLGDEENAKARAKMAGNIYVTQSVLLRHILEGDEGKRHNQNLLLTYLDLIGSSLYSLCQNQDYERYLWLHEFYLKLMDMYFDDGFYGFYATRALQRHHWLARIYTGVRNDEAKACEHLEAAEKMAAQYDGLSGKYVYTSTLLNGLEGDMSNTTTNSPETKSADLLEWISDELFDRWRGKDWFIALESRLREKAAKK